MSRHAGCSEEGWQWAEGCGCLLLDPPPRTGGEGVSAVSAGLVNLVLVPVSFSMYVRKVEVDQQLHFIVQRSFDRFPNVPVLVPFTQCFIETFEVTETQV